MASKMCRRNWLHVAKIVHTAAVFVFSLKKAAFDAKEGIFKDWKGGTGRYRIGIN